jgi:predicted outer membrane protein
MNRFSSVVRGSVGLLVFALLFYGCGGPDGDHNENAVNAAGPGTQPPTDDRSQPSHTSQAGTGGTDQLLNQAVEMNAAEVQLGRLGERKAQNAKVKQFARMMVTDHTRAIEHLRGGAAISGQAGSAMDRPNMGSSAGPNGSPGSASGQANTGQGQNQNRNKSVGGTDAASNSGYRAETSGPMNQTGITDVPLSAEHQQIIQRLEGLSGAEFDREFMQAMVDGHRKALQFFEQHAGTGSGSPTAKGTAPAGTGMNADVARRAQELIPKIRQHLEEAERIQASLQTGGSGTNKR